jgi:RNA polymerase sigma-54 factor
MSMEQSMDMSPDMQQRVSPSLIAANYILALSSQELQQAISQEISENPAIELLDKPTCPTCGATMMDSVCPNCMNRLKQTTTATDAQEGWNEDFSTMRRTNQSEEDFDPVNLVASERTMAEQLLMDVTVAIEPEDVPIAEYLIGNLDERGFLAATTSEVSALFGVDEERIEDVLVAVQSVGPVGVGARNIQECLLLQLDFMEEEGEEIPPSVRKIIAGYLKDLGEHKYGHIAQELGITTDEVTEVRDFVKDRLSPYPAEDFKQAQTWSSPSRSAFVSPDVIIMDKEGHLEAEVVESKHFMLRVNPMYRSLMGELDDKEKHYSEEDRNHIRHYVSRARLFISNIRQRRETMEKITNCLIDCQAGFLRDGVSALRPLTRAMVASTIGVHESTVSRATASKFVMLPNRQVIPFSDFFTPSLTVKSAIKRLIEDEGKPLTDQQIVNRLRTDGIRVARRTVAKYRSQLRILPSTLR